MCVSPRSPHLFFEIYFTGGRCHLAWCVLTLADENYRGEPHEILVKCFKNFVYPWFARRKLKKRQIPNGSSKYFIYWSIYELFYNSARKKQNWNNRRISQMNSNFFRQGVCSFFLVDLRVYTSGNIFLPLARAQQTLLILCSVGVSVVLHLRSYAI